MGGLSSPGPRILLLEDSAADAELLERELRRGGVACALLVERTREGFLRALDEFVPSLVLSDYTLPGFDGMSALEAVRARDRDLPFVFVSGSIGEERAVEALRHGATDYILKGQFARLVPAVRRALDAAAERAELRHVEAQLRQAQKMEAFGQLAGGIAHDFNNLLTVINGYTEMVLAVMDSRDPNRASLQEVHAAGVRAAALTRQLLAIGRKQVIVPRVLDLNAVVEDMGRLLRRVIGEDVVLVTVLAPDLGRVRADPGQVEQVLMNLAVNARDAMPKGGRLTLETSNVRLEGRDAGDGSRIAPGPYVRISVRDEGTGMDEATLARIFEPFFTTKEKGKGTGLGLSTAYGIVRQSGGHVFAESAPGLGTTMRVCLPRVEDPAQSPDSGPEGPIPGGTEALLVVEDNDPVREFLCEVLRGCGYAVEAARDGEEAMRILADRRPPPRLVVTDLVMPGMSGKELADRIRERLPGLRMLLLSGTTGNALLHRGVLPGDLAFLQKPCRPDDLARKVREVLDS